MQEAIVSTLLAEFPDTSVLAEEGPDALRAYVSTLRAAED